MRAVIKNATETHYGNLIWMPPYLYPKYELEKAIKAMETMGYYISCFPEGDGLCFKHETKPEKEIFNDFKVNFRWMVIKEYSRGEEFNFQKDILDYQIIIMPISRLRCENIIHAGKYSIYPNDEFPFNTINIKASKNPLRDHVTSLTQVSVDTYRSHPIIVFTTKLIDHDSYNSMDQTQDEGLIKKLSQETDLIMDLVKYYHGEYFHPEYMVANTGLWAEKYSTAMIYFPKQNVAHIQAREVEVKTFIKSLGIDLIHNDFIEINPMLNFEINETGNIAKHALRLNSTILETDDLTMKFSMIMTLFEHMANPYEYEKFQIVKGKIGLHATSNKTNYHKLMQRFEELTAGLKKNDGSKDRILGVRTSIIHLGKRIEDLIPIKENQKKLFEELQSYTKSVIDDMISFSHLTWDEFELEREKLKLNLKI
ncbi:hypothetical protein [Reichenbachiella ulvae]|uniref:Apea-like HEPN domain-containing protein n=1 Tax=Reichenbachiella ulvae TaxID=2980104 RepID=A0ABT3CZP3_9BACT|nr:hypothetical protein [Reichenbachiella ulvae]MCV9389150.1 hypothetical protein [Reichenbachiella ulvae]